MYITVARESGLEESLRVSLLLWHNREDRLMLHAVSPYLPDQVGVRFRTREMQAILHFRAYLAYCSSLFPPPPQAEEGAQEV